jgi:L-alanine-DL-glutamate epimerase-like enolase superfamily enzyme
MKHRSTAPTVFDKPMTLSKDGYFDVPTGPGLGVTIRKDLYEK